MAQKDRLRWLSDKQVESVKLIKVNLHSSNSYLQI